MVLYNDELDERQVNSYNISKRYTTSYAIYGKIYAIIGGQYGEWELKQDDKQDDNLEDIKQFWDWENKKFILPEFRKFI